MAFGIESSFELEHVSVLLGVDVIIGEVHRNVFDLELHGGYGDQPPLPVLAERGDV